MTTIIINERTKKGRIILDLVRELSCGKIINEDTAKDPQRGEFDSLQKIQ